MSDSSSKFSEKNSSILSVGPSRYRILNDGSANVVEWEIVLADNSCHKILNYNLNNSISGFHFNVRALPIVGLSAMSLDDLFFTMSECSCESTVFELSQSDLCNICLPNIRYSFYDLSLRVEMSLKNVSVFPIYWCPVIMLNLHLPWHKNLSLDQYVIHSKAKKKLVLNKEYTILESGRCSDKLPLRELDSGIIAAISNIQDPRVAITTKNEEETIYVTFNGKYPNACLGLSRSDTEYCTKLLCMMDIPEDEPSGEFLHHKCIPSGQTDTFAIELSVC